MTAHVASNDVSVSDRWVRQRCVWCGLLLVDVDVTRIAMPIEQYDEALQGVDRNDGAAVLRALVSVWPAGRLVDVSGTNPTVTTLLDESDRFPDDACMALDPAVTA